MTLPVLTGRLEGSPAEEAGLQAREHHNLNGRHITAYRDISACAPFPSGDAVQVQFHQGKEARERKRK